MLQKLFLTGMKWNCNCDIWWLSELYRHLFIYNSSVSVTQSLTLQLFTFCIISVFLEFIFQLEVPKWTSWKRKRPDLLESPSAKPKCAQPVKWLNIALDNLGDKYSGAWCKTRSFIGKKYRQRKMESIFDRIFHQNWVHLHQIFCLYYFCSNFMLFTNLSKI